MEALQWTHAELAKRTGLAIGTISNVLAGIDPSWTSRLKINAALGRDIFTPMTYSPTAKRSKTKRSQRNL
jgi:transcriptional regulator with XRE-family HTH domain